MVLAWPVGKPRSFPRGFWLAFVTVGAYGFYWDYKAHVELYQQFELRREGREEGAAWYIVSFLFWVLRFVYYHHFTANLHYLMTRMGHRRPPTPGGILALKVPATTTLFLSLSVGALLVLADAPGAPGGATGMLLAGLVLMATGVAVWGVLKAIAYHRLQTAVNWVWGMYDARMRQLSGPRGPPVAHVAGGAPPAARPPYAPGPAGREAGPSARRGPA